jgi:hypothetical protein
MCSWYGRCGSHLRGGRGRGAGGWVGGAGGRLSARLRWGRPKGGGGRGTRSPLAAAAAAPPSQPRAPGGPRAPGHAPY